MIQSEAELQAKGILALQKDEDDKSIQSVFFPYLWAFPLIHNDSLFEEIEGRGFYSLIDSSIIPLPPLGV